MRRTLDDLIPFTSVVLMVPIVLAVVTVAVATGLVVLTAAVALSSLFLPVVLVDPLILCGAGSKCVGWSLHWLRIAVRSACMQRSMAHP